MSYLKTPRVANQLGYKVVACLWKGKMPRDALNFGTVAMTPLEIL